MPAVSYNGVNFPFVQTTSFSQTALADETGQTDWYLTKFDITIQAYFNADVLPLLFPSLAGVDTPASGIMSAIRTRLLQPRQAFSVTCDGFELIPSRQQGNAGRVDARNGPVPQSCDIISLNDVAFIVTWHVVAHYWENNQVNIADNGGLDPIINQVGNPVLYNRWSETQEIDECLYTRKTREGKYVIRSDNSVGQIVDTFRGQMAVLGLEKGFVRESASYTVDPSGLGLSYRFVDREVFKMPPTPAWKASGTYTESTTKLGCMRHGELYLKLEGAQATDQGKLISAILAIASTKLQINGVLTGAGAGAAGAGAALSDPIRSFAIVEHCHLTVGMWENWVELRIRAMMLPATSNEGKAKTQPGKFWGINLGAMTYTPITDKEERDMGNEWLIRGTSGLLLQAAAYFNPDLRNVKIDKKTGQLDAGGKQREVGQAGKQAEQ